MTTVFLAVLRLFYNIQCKINLLAAKPTMNPDPFSYIKGNKMTDNAAIRETSASWYKLMKTLGVIGMACTIIICGAILAMTKKSEKREEVKKQLMIKAGIFIAICAFVWLFGQAYEIASSLV